MRSSCQFQCIYKILVESYQFVLKILTRNEIMTEGWNDNDGQPKSSIVPLFQSGAIITSIVLYIVYSLIDTQALI